MSKYLILKARNLLEQNRHKKSFEKIDDFFELPFIRNNTLMNDLHNHLRVLKTNYYNIEEKRRKGVISFNEYEVSFNRISDALFSFFDSILEENEEINNSKTSRKAPDQKSIRIILVLDKEFEDFNEQKAMVVINKIREILNLEGVNFQFDFLREGSVNIGIKIRKSYKLLVYLKSIVLLNIIEDLLLIKASNKLMDRFCSNYLSIQSHMGQINLTNFNFANQNLSNSNFSNKNLSHVNFSGSDLSFSNFNNSYLHSTNFTNANLIGAKIIGANLTDSILRKANLKNVDLRNSNLYSSDLTEANFTNADLSNSNLESSNFRESILFKSNLHSSDLHNACLIHSNLQRTNFSYSDLSGANLDYADIKETNFTRADLTNTRMVKTFPLHKNLLESKIHNTIFHIDDSFKLRTLGINLNSCVFIDNFNNQHEVLNA